MSVNYDYDPEAASKADNISMRIDRSDAFIGQVKEAHAIKSENTGTTGIHFEFTSQDGGMAGFDVYTHKSDGQPTFGNNQIQALMALLGLRGLKSVSGKFEAMDWDAGKRVERDGEVFPDLCNKDIGFVLQKELYNRKSDGKESYRMNLLALFHPVSRLTSSELKEGKVKPEKLEKVMKSLKDKDSRNKTGGSEPAQPAVGGVEGSF